MSTKDLKDLTKRSENYSQWYNDLVVKADLAEQSPVRGCMGAFMLFMPVPFSDNRSRKFPLACSPGSSHV